MAAPGLEPQSLPAFRLLVPIAQFEKGVASMPEQAMTQEELRLSDDEQLLRLHLEPVAARHFPGRASRIESIERKRSEFSSFYASDILTVHLAGGDTFKVFLKDFGSFHHPKDTMKERREREVAVYRDILADSGLDTPEY